MDNLEPNGHGKPNESLYEEVVRAGKRTYFFDVKATKGNDYYLNITESIKRYKDDGSHFFQKHKIFLYKEDFEKFEDALRTCINKIVALREKEEQ